MHDYFSSTNLEKCKNFLTKEKNRILTSFVAVFILGLIAHAYGFLNLTIGHDSLAEFYLSQGYVHQKISIGRFMVPVYLYIFHGRISQPWLNGLFALCWLSVSVWMVAYLFSITDKLRITLIAAIFTVNISIIALAATYIHDLDADMFAVMLNVGMVFLWVKGEKRAWLGVVLLVAALGIYQSIISVSISLIIFISILALLQGEKCADVIRKGLRAVCILAVAGAIYFLAIKVICLLIGTGLSSSYNGLTHLYDRSWGIKHSYMLVRQTYMIWQETFFHSFRSRLEMRLLHLLLAIPAFAAIIHAMIKKEIPVQNKLLVLLSMILLPFCMNISCFLSDGMSHDLMYYAIWLTYLMVLLLTHWYKSSSDETLPLPIICYWTANLALLFIFLTNIQTSNSAYVKKDLERQATLSLMTMLHADMKKTEGYVAGETEVAFLGSPPTGCREGFHDLSSICGLNLGAPFTYCHDSYFKYFLQTPLRQTEKEIPKEIQDSMKSYPQKDSIQWYGKILVIKLSDW